MQINFYDMQYIIKYIFFLNKSIYIEFYFETFILNSVKVELFVNKNIFKMMSNQN